MSCLWSERANMYPVRVPEIVNFSSKSFAARRCGVLHSCAVALTRHGAVMSSCTGRSESPGRAQTRARALRAHAEGIYAEGTCIYLQLSPLSPPFSQVLLSFHQHRKKAPEGFWTVLVELLVRLLVAFPTAA